MPSYLQRQSKTRGPAGRAPVPPFDQWTERRKVKYSNQRRPNSYVTGGRCSRMNRHRLRQEVAALASPAVRLAASASTRSINSFDTNRTMCCPLFCGRLLRSPVCRMRSSRSCSLREVPSDSVVVAKLRLTGQGSFAFASPSNELIWQSES